MIKPKGMDDFYPNKMEIRNKVFNSLRETSKKYGFLEIEAPAIESMSLLTKKSGEEIKSQIFTLDKRSDESLGLRFEITASAARMFIAKQKSLAKPVKWFSLSRMWRYERPQKGRMREFYQLSSEIYGSSEAEADASIISYASDCLINLGLSIADFEVRINNRKLLEGLIEGICFKKNVEAVIRIIDKKSKITEADFESELKKLKLKKEQIDSIKSLFSLSIKEIKNQELNKTAAEGLSELNFVLDLLKNRKNVHVDLSTARGLAYYTGTVFEIFDSSGKFRSICGGGRYDEMISLFGGVKTPATGFAIGYSTLMLLLSEKNLIPKIDLGPDYYIVIINEEAREKAFVIASELRQNYTVDIDLNRKNVGNQLKYANNIKAKKVIFIGPDEIKSGNVKVKDMKTGKEEVVRIDEL